MEENVLVEHFLSLVVKLFDDAKSLVLSIIMYPCKKGKILRRIELEIEKDNILVYNTQFCSQSETSHSLQSLPHEIICLFKSYQGGGILPNF